LYKPCGQHGRSPGTRRIVDASQGHLGWLKTTGRQLRGLATAPYLFLNCRQEGLAGTGDAAGEHDQLGIVRGGQPYEGGGEMPGDPTCHLLGGSVTLGGSSEQRGGRRAGGPSGPGAGYRRAGRHGLETSPLAAPAHRAGFVDDDMPDLAGHAMGSA
jgi:hypothetical protein